MSRQEDNDKKPLQGSAVLRCTFVGGDERGGFTGEQLRYPCKLRRHICAKCGMHRGEHCRPYAGVRDEDLPPRKRSVFRRLGEFQLLDLDVGGGKEDDVKEEEPEEGQIDDALAITKTKGKRGPRRRRAAWCEF